MFQESHLNPNWPPGGGGKGPESDIAEINVLKAVIFLWPFLLFLTFSVLCKGEFILGKKVFHLAVRPPIGCRAIAQNLEIEYFSQNFYIFCRRIFLNEFKK